MSDQNELNDDIDEIDTTDEISDEELDDVSGGFNPQPDPPGKTHRGSAF